MVSDTIYIVHDPHGVTRPVFDADRAERLSQAGITVTATTRRTEQ
jgi:hypothetical protein